MFHPGQAMINAVIRPASTTGAILSPITVHHFNQSRAGE
jgi:hypothetical protein